MSFIDSANRSTAQGKNWQGFLNWRVTRFSLGAKRSM